LIELSRDPKGLWMQKMSRKKKDAIEAPAASGKMSRKDFEKEFATLQSS
jgi:hypothetical protein